MSQIGCAVGCRSNYVPLLIGRFNRQTSTHRLALSALFFSVSDQRSPGDMRVCVLQAPRGSLASIAIVRRAA